jgi:hypothetical protein
LEAIVEMLKRAVEQLLGRASGPLHLRLVLQPIVATVIAVRAGLKDAREGQPAFFWTVLTNPAERQRLLHSGWKDIVKIFVVAVVLDAVYQVVEFRAFYAVQALIVAIVLAIVPYVLLRGPVTRLKRRLSRSTSELAMEKPKETISHR